MSRGVLAGSGAFRSLGRSIAFASGSFLGGVGFTVLLKQSISAASDLVEQTNKANVVFRSSAGEIRNWSKTSAESMGIAQHEALALAATFGNLLVPMGFTRKGAADMSKSLVGLAADLASFNNASPEETLHALQSGLVGQVRPLRQFGIFLSDDRVKAEALSSGIVKANVSLSKLAEAQTAVSIAEARVADARKNYGTGTTQYASAINQLRRAHDQVHKALAGQTIALTDAQKAQARYNIILKDSSDAQGDFSRTSGQLANQQRILKAHLSDLEGEIGTALLPTVLNLTRRLNTWIQHAQKTGEIQRDVNQAVRIGTGLFNAISDTVKTFTPVVKTLNSALGGTKHTFELLFALGAAAKLRGIATALGLIGTRAEAAGGAKGVGLLLGNLKLLKALGPITIAITVLEYISRKTGIPGPFHDEVQQPGSEPPSWMTKGMQRLGGGWWKSGSHYLHWNPQKGEWDKDTRTPPNIKQGPPPDTAAPGGGADRSGVTYHGQHTTHETSGLRGYPAVDIMAKPGTNVLAPENGAITRHSGRPPSAGAASPHGAFGWSLYFAGDSGTTYFMTHLGWVAPLGGYRKGAVIGKVGDFPGGTPDHVHIGVHRGSSSAAHQPSVPGASQPPTGPGDVVVGHRRTPGRISGEELLPDPIQSQLSRSRTTRDRGDDLKVLDRAIDWVSGQLKRHDLGRKKRQQYEKLLTQLNRERDRDETQLEGKIKTPKVPPTKTYLGATRSYGDITSGRSRRTEVDPAIGKVSIPISVQPTIADYKALIKKLDAAYIEVKKKLKAATKKRAQVTRALKRAERMHHRNPKHIHNLRQTIANLGGQIAEYKFEMKNLRDDIIQARGALADLGVTAPGDLPTDLETELSDAEAAGDIQGEIDILGKEHDFLQHEIDTGVDEYGHRLTPEEILKIKRRLAAVDKTRTDLLKGLQDSREAELVDLPDKIKLDLAQATLTPETTDDLAALEEARDYYTRALQDPNLSTDAKIALINGLHDVNEQIKSLKGQSSANAMAFLTDIRDIRQYESTLTPRLGSGTQVTVTNNFAGAPADPHTYSANMAFDLKALVN